MATDQEIRDAGLKYVPKQKYLQNPYELPVEETPPDNGITNTNAFTDSQRNDFSVYNPDPNSIVNRNYDPRRYYDATYEDTFGTNLGDPEALTATGARFAEPNTKMSGILNMVPGAGIARFLKNTISPLMPINRRAIMENQLSGQGIMVNDIGQIVSDGGNINTAENIMAGYNANKVTAETFQKRRDMINDKMKDLEQKAAKLAALNAAEAKMLGTDPESALTQTDKIEEFEKEKKKKLREKNVLGRYLNKRDRVSLAEQQTNPEGPSNASSGTAGGSPDNFNGGTTYDNSGGDFRNADGSNVNQDFSTTASVSNYDPSVMYAKGGRAGYFFGGRVNYKTGGRIGFQGGGSDASSDDFGTSTSTPGPGDTGGEGGNNPSDSSGSQFGGSNNNNDGASDNPPVTVVNNNPVDISTVTKSVGDYNIPYGVEALMANKGRLQAVLNADNVLDKNLGAEFTYDKGPFSIGAYADMDGDKSLNANYTRNNSNYSFDLNDGGGQLKFTRTFANGGLVGLL